MTHKTKLLVKLAAAMLLFFSVAPLHAAVPLHANGSKQTMGFTKPNKMPPLIRNTDLMQVIAGDATMTFSLDLHFGTGTDDQPVLSIMPLIHYNSKKIDVIGISNPLHAGIFKPNLSELRNYIHNYKPDPPLPAITIARKSMAADTDTAMQLIWLDINGISDVAEATIESPVRIITIAFKWKAGAMGNSYIGITQSGSGVAHEFDGTSIIVRGPATASITAQPKSIDVTAGITWFRVKCTLSRPLSTGTTCILARRSNAEALASVIIPAIEGATIIIPPGETSVSRAFLIAPFKSDSGRILSIVLDGADADGAKLAEISLTSPGLMISESSIVTEEGETEEFLVKLATRPANGSVVVNVSSSNEIEATVMPPSLTFTASNWNKQQRVSVTGVDDKFVDGDQPYKIMLNVDVRKTSAKRYLRITASVPGKTTDNDEAKPVLTAEPNKELTVGKQQIVITVTLKGGGVFESDTLTVLRKAGGSARESVDYAPFTLPYIIIPASTASASATFAITIRKAAVTTIVIAGELAVPGIRISGIALGIGKFSWDVDSSRGFNAADVIMITRYLLGVRGAALVANQSHANGDTVTGYLDRSRGFLNVSGDNTGEPDGIDGILIARYLGGHRGDSLVRGLVPSHPPPDMDPDVVERNIAQFLP